MSIRYFLTFILIAVTLSTLFFQMHLTRKISLASFTITEIPDAYVQHIVALQMNNEGLPDMQLVSPLAFHYPKEDSILLSEPQVTLYKTKQAPWVLTALHGKAINNVEIIYLWDQVKLHQAAGKGTTETTVKTSKVTFDRPSKIATTDQFVTLERPGVRVQSTGARANIQTNEVNLLSDVQVYYHDRPNK